MGYTLRMESCSTMKARSAARPSSRAKSAGRSQQSISACRTGSISATSTPSVTGATHAIMLRACQQDQPDDFILATGETYTVREFVERAFERAGHRIRWTGEGTAEKGIDKVSGRVFVEVDKRYFRPTEVDILLDDPSKARAKLGWRHRTSFDQLVNEMVDKDLELMARDGNRWKPYE